MDVLRGVGLPAIDFKILARQPLPSEIAEFDLITIMGTGFDKDRVGEELVSWGFPEWEFFTQDLINRISKTGGRIFFSHNFNHPVLGVSILKDQQYLDWLRTHPRVQSVQVNVPDMLIVVGP